MEVLNELLTHLPGRTFKAGTGEIRLIPLSETKEGFHELAGLDVGSYPPHIHDNSTATILVVCGKGTYTVGGESVEYKAGTKIYVPAGTPHGFEVREPTWLHTVQDHPIMDEHGNADFRYA